MARAMVHPVPTSDVGTWRPSKQADSVASSSGGVRHQELWFGRSDFDSSSDVRSEPFCPLLDFQCSNIRDCINEQEASGLELEGDSTIGEQGSYGEDCDAFSDMESLEDSVVVRWRQLTSMQSISSTPRRRHSLKASNSRKK